MAFHVPFNQRASARHNQQTPQPVYIGFDVPAAPPRRAFNWWGFNGLWLSIASLFTAGFMSPVPLLISLVGLRRPGKKMAAVGTFTSLAGIALATTIVFGTLAAKNARMEQIRVRQYNKAVAKQVLETKKLLVVAGEEIEAFQNENEGSFPSDIDANLLVIKHVDPWGESLRFDLEKDHGVLRSAGPDQDFYTRDDVSVKIKGRVADTTPLLPVDQADADQSEVGETTN